MRNASEFYALGLGDPLPASSDPRPGDRRPPRRRWTCGVPRRNRPKNEGRATRSKSRSWGGQTSGSRPDEQPILGEERRSSARSPGPPGRDRLLNQRDGDQQLHSHRYGGDPSGGVKIERSIEYGTASSGSRAISAADVCITVLDAAEGPPKDTRIAGYAHEAGKGSTRRQQVGSRRKGE